MEYYHYINIFGTNGLEDILIISFLISFVFFVRRLSKPSGNAIRKNNQLPSAADGLLVVPPEDENHKE